LLAVTITVVLIRPALRHHHEPAAVSKPHAAALKRASTAGHGRRVYVVRPGDTLESIAARTHVALSRLRRLNPHVAPTALFIGEKIRLR
jgi:LysM repeat protein